MRRTLPLGLAAAIALAGCGGSGGGGKSITVSNGKPIPVTAGEYSFDPKSITVDSGGSGPTDVHFSLKNGGAQAHDLHVTRGGQDLGGTPIFGPGQTKSGTVKLAPGSYEFICTVGDHADLGMKGKLTVK